MIAEGKLPLDMQRRHIRATVSAGAEWYHVQSNFVMATGPRMATLKEANDYADYVDAMFRHCPPHQWCCAAQAV